MSRASLEVLGFNGPEKTSNPSRHGSTTPDRVDLNSGTFGSSCGRFSWKNRARAQLVFRKLPLQFSYFGKCMIVIGVIGRWMDLWFYVVFSAEDLCF